MTLFLSTPLGIMTVGLALIAAVGFILSGLDK